MIKNSENLVKKILLYRINKDFTFERLRDQLLKKPASLLYSLNITPNALSISGLILILIASLLWQYPFIAAILMILNLLADGLDGVIARLYNLSSFKGSLVDTVCDTLGSIFIVITLSLFYKLDFWQTMIWLAAIVIYSIVTALHSIKVEKRSKVLGFRNFINVGAIILLFCIGSNAIEMLQVAPLISLYMQNLSLLLIALSVYIAIRIRYTK